MITESRPASRIIEAVGYVEIHFHLLPSVDDGPPSIEESVALAVAAVSDGTRTVVATPHVHAAHITDPMEIPARVREVAERLQRERISLRVLPGGELAHDMVPRLSNRELESIAQGPPGKQWLLLEAPFSGLDDGFTAAADELRKRGFAVVVAHPERASPTCATEAVLMRELAVGSVLQLTAWSFVGLYGERVRRTALRLLSSTPRAAIASDAHGAERMPALRSALEALAAGGEHDPTRFTAAIPRALLEQGLTGHPRALVA